MKTTIWKFPLATSDLVRISMPQGAELLCVQVQGDIAPCVWAKIAAENHKRVFRLFRIIGTGHPIEDNCGTYLGTFQLYAGALVFHVFDLGEEEQA